MDFKALEPGRAAVEHGNRDAAGREPPRNAEPDHPGPDDGDRSGLGNNRCEALRHQAAPFAGMTQTGSMGLISAAPFARGTPGRNSQIMGDSAPFHKAGSGPPMP